MLIAGYAAEVSSRGMRRLRTGGGDGDGGSVLTAGVEHHRLALSE